jgi:hypothetical protein
MSGDLIKPNAALGQLATSDTDTTNYFPIVFRQAMPALSMAVQLRPALNLLNKTYLPLLNSPASSVARLRTHRSAIVAWLLFSRKTRCKSF